MTKAVEYGILWLMNGRVETEFLMSKADKITDGVYRIVAHIGASKAIDGEAHELPIEGPVIELFTKRGKPVSKEVYEHYLTGVDLALRAKVKAESGMLISAPKLSDEERAAHKVERDAKRQARAAISEVVESLNLTPEQVKEILLRNAK